MGKLKSFVRGIPVAGEMIAKAYRKCFGKTTKPFSGSSAYWESRYASGGTSGVGSYTRFAEFKAEVLNAFAVEHEVQSVIEFGCGDGNQLKLARYPKYLGLDVSETIIAKCKEEFEGDENKRFATVVEYRGEKMDLALSLDVIYPLVEDEVFEEYMRVLFESSNRYVIIYSSDEEGERGPDSPHVRHRKWSAWVERNVAGWYLMRHIPNRFPYTGDYTKGSFADFFIYAKAQEVLRR